MLLAIASYFLLVVPRQRRFDFYPRWVGARAVLAGENPYSQEVTWRIQEGMFGRRLESWEDQQRFAYPATIAWFLLPFWLLPFPLAISLWCGLQFLLLLILPLFVADMLLVQDVFAVADSHVGAEAQDERNEGRFRLLRLTVALFFSVLLYRYPINAYLLGQFVLFSLACLVIAGWGLVRDRPLVVTLALLGVTVRPEVASFPLLVLLLAAWRAGQRKVAGTWAGVLGLLWLLTRVRIGPWVGDLLTGIEAYAGYSFPRWPLSVVLPGWVAVLVAAGVLAWGAWMWLRMRALSVGVWVTWGVSVAALIALVLLPQTNDYVLTLGLLPAWVMLWAARARWLDWLPVLVVLASPWVFYVSRGYLPARLEQLLIPLALGALLTFRWRHWQYRVGGAEG
jgi:hypothetical protein